VATRQKALQLMTTINIPMVMQDVDALLAFAGKDKAASTTPMGCVGYCMSGQYAMNAAVRHKDKIRAAASIYGVALVTDKLDSPHLVPQRTDARLYFGCAEKDPYAPMEMIDQLRAEVAAKAATLRWRSIPALTMDSRSPRALCMTSRQRSAIGALVHLFGEALKG